MKRSQRRAVLTVALSITASLALLGCDYRSRRAAAMCGAGSGSAASLAAPTPVWTHIGADSVYYAPRGVDLDGDGKLEVLLTGGNEMPQFGEVVALDGTTGGLKWRVGTDEELYSSAVVLDVDGDGVKDVVVGGREQTFLAIDGARGRVLWRFEDTRQTPEYYFHNFYTPVLVPDQDQDGLPDLLVSNGGADAIPPGEARPPGYLLVLSSASGALLASAVLPDGQETYLSPILLPVDGDGAPTILFGTGGETWGGSLWRAPLSAVLNGDLSSAIKLVTGERKGMIAPPALADLNRDGQLDVVVATFDGRLLALDGATNAILWQRAFDGAESFTTPALGYFDGDDVPDVFAVFLRGTFPSYIGAERVLLSGRDGRQLWQGEAGDFAMAGDVAVDLDGDGTDEVIFNVNTLRDPLTGLPSRQGLYWLDAVHRQTHAWGEVDSGFAAGSPWVGDLDGDGCLDLLLPRHGLDPDRNDGLLTRFRVAAPVPENISWGGYFGTAFDSVVQPPS